ncbi:MAG: hypothetical protein ACRCZ9_05720 [Fusobacteriaceae bacterium]
MAIVLRVKNSQIEPKITGLLFQNTYYVDDRMTDGLKLGFFAHLTDQGTSIGVPAATLVHANAKEGRKAVGIVYDASKRSEYTSANNWNGNIRLFPYGMRQDNAVGLLKYGVIEISDTEATKHRHFESIREENVPVTNLKMLQKISIDNAGTPEVRFVSNIAADGKTVTTVLADGTTPLTHAETEKVTRLGQMGDAIYLAGWSESNIVPGSVNAMAIPFPFVTWKTGQVVGYIESPIAVRIDLRDEFLNETVLSAEAATVEPNGEQLNHEVATAEHKFVANEIPNWLETIGVKAAAKAITKGKPSKN